MGLFEEIKYGIRQLYQYSENVTFLDILDEVTLRTVIGSAICVIPFLVVIGIIYWFVRRSWQKRRCTGDFGEMRRRCRLNELVRLLLVCWAAGITLFVILPYNFCQQLFWSLRYMDWAFDYRQSPWTFGGYQLRSALLARLMGTATESRWDREMLIGNAALFAPLGFALPLVWKKGNFPRTMLAGLGCALFVELIQPLFERSGDVDDLIFNLLGVAAGYLLFLVVRLIFPKFIETCQQTVKVKKSHT